MSGRATDSASQQSSLSERPDARVEQTLALIRTLIGSLPEPHQDQICREIAEKVRPMSALRAGEVLGAIVQLLPKRKNWTVSEIKQRIDEQGVSASPKEVYNAIGYLARRGRVIRVGYGRYVVDGAEIATSDDFGGATSRYEDEYRTNRE
jgi:hypothetical protein